MIRTVSSLTLLSLLTVPNALAAPPETPPRPVLASVAPVLPGDGGGRTELPPPHVATPEEIARSEREIPPDERADASGEQYPVALEPGDPGYAEAIRAFARRGAGEDDEEEAALGAGVLEDALPEEGDPTELQRFAAQLEELGALPDAPGGALGGAAGGMGIAVGRPGAGRLVNGIQFPLDHPAFHVWRPRYAYGTVETIDGIIRAVEAVHERFPDTPPIALGDISAPRGGRLRPHRSHQNGLDVDIGFYYLDTDGSRRFFGGSRQIDLARTFALVEAFIDLGNVRYIFLDYRIQRRLYEYGRDQLGYPTELLDAWFQYPHGYGDQHAVVRHVRGHANHLHVRFLCPDEQETCQD